MGKKFKTTILLITLLTTQSCVPALIIGGGAAVGTSVAQERSVGNAIDDATTWTRVKNAIFTDEEAKKVFLKVGVKVIEGRVLLTGSVENPEDRVKILRIVWAQEGVKEVINEIAIHSSDNKPGILDMAKDSWITTQFKSKILVNKDIRSINYSVETINQVVYLIGISRNEDELDAVTNIASTIPGVVKVVSYVRIKNSETRQKMLFRNRD